MAVENKAMQPDQINKKMQNAVSDPAAKIKFNQAIFLYF